MLDIQKRLSPGFYALLSLPSTAMGFALSVQISALSWILSTKYKLEIHEIGLVWAAGPIAGILGQVIVGIISDNVWFLNGRRRPFILIGGFLAALMLLALPSIDVISNALGVEAILGVAIAVALTLDLSINISFNPTRAIIADVTPEGEERIKGYTWMQTISGTFGVLAYAVGALWDNYTLIYFGAILVLLLSVIPPFFIEEPRQLAAVEAEEPRRYGFKEVMLAIMPLWGFLLYAIYGMTVRLAHVTALSPGFEIFCLVLTLLLIGTALMKSEKGKSKLEAGDIGFKKVLAAHAFTWLGIQTMFVYMFAFIQNKMPQLSDIEMGRMASISFLVFNAIAAVLPAPVLGPLSAKFGRVRVHTVSIASMAIGYAVLLFFGNSPLAIYLIMGFLGIGWAATVSLAFAIMSQKIDKSRMGLYMGLFNLSVVLPQLAASLGVGELISATADKSIIFVVCTLCLAISAVAWLFVAEEKTDVAAKPAAGNAGH